MTENQTLETLKQMNRKLELILAVLATSNLETDIRIKRLSDLGLTSTEIERIVGLDASYVRVKLSRLRKGRA